MRSCIFPTTRSGSGFAGSGQLVLRRDRISRSQSDKHLGPALRRELCRSTLCCVDPDRQRCARSRSKSACSKSLASWATHLRASAIIHLEVMCVSIRGKRLFAIAASACRILSICSRPPGRGDAAGRRAAAIRGDYAHRTLTLATPGGDCRIDSQPVPSTINPKTGFVTVDDTIGGRAYSVVVDAGSGGASAGRHRYNHERGEKCGTADDCLRTGTNITMIASQCWYASDHAKKTPNC